MSAAIFNYDDFQTLIARFTAEVPAVLSSHHTVADLVPRVERLLSAVETPFTIAVVGQMRAGKSSLLNALVGAELAVTGVTETTATINWFKHGSKEQEGRFRVEWKDRPAEEFPLAELGKWVGDSERARATRCIEFYRDVPFLRQANIVDTPGTRSVIADHARALHEFLALKQERDTRSAGESADAVLYVLMPVARQADADLLSDFEKTTRIPGSSPYNSLAIVHKWETLECDDPHTEALRKCEQVRAALEDKVSLVLPVSAPLAWASRQFGDSFWSQARQLAMDTPADVLEELLLREEDFLDWEEPACPLNVSARRQLRQDFKLPWPTFKLVLKVARNRCPSSAADLREQLGRLSGIEELHDALARRFLARSRMIKAFSILSRAWEPCQIASARLRNYKNRISRLLEEADESLRALAEAVAGGAAALEPVLHYVEETRRTVEQDLRQASESLRRLGEGLLTIKDAYDDMEADLRMLEQIDGVRAEIGDEWFHILRALFGYGGPAVVDRTAPLRLAGQAATRLEDIEQALDQARKRQARLGAEGRKLFEHALLRLQQIADLLEAQHKPQEP
jgi:hypothetical protein